MEMTRQRRPCRYAEYIIILSRVRKIFEISKSRLNDRRYRSKLLDFSNGARFHSTIAISVLIQKQNS